MQEFNALKPELKRQIGIIMDKHPVFSTALIARRCFASKSASNEYHFGRPGIPVTLRELEEKMVRDVTSFDHFKHMATVMAERMVESVKGEFTNEASIIKTEVEEKLLKDPSESSTTVSDPPAVVNNSGSRASKRGNNKENSAAEEKPAKVQKSEAKPTRESKRGGGQKKKNETNADPVEKVNDTKPVKEEPKPAAVSNRGGRKKKAPALTKKETRAKKEEAPATEEPPTTAPEAEVKDEESEANQSVQDKPKTTRGRKKVEKGTKATKSKKQQNENVPSEEKGDETVKKEVKDEVKVEAKPAPDNNTKPTAKGGRKRKSGSALAPVNSNRGAKVQKTVAAKIISGSPGSPAKIAIAGTNLVSLSSLSQPLPPHIVLPTTPVAAPQVQNLKTSTGPPPQVIQLRPAAGGLVSSTTSNPTTTMQIRPLRAAGANAVGPRPQFFKIVGGKPVQISGSNVQRLPLGAAPGLPGQGGGNRFVVMRAPVPSSQGAAAVPASVAANATTTSPGAGNKIILLSNKGQALPTAGKGQPGAPSIVRIVSPNNLASGGAGKVALAPNSPTKVTTLRQAVGASGPILLRTVAPKGSGANASTSPPIRLPMAPLPKSALATTTQSSANNKKTVTQVLKTVTQANDNVAKAIQVLLPKSPLPQTATLNNSTAAGPPSKVIGSSSSKVIGGSPSKPLGGFTTTTTTTKNGAFVWTNSTRANFKLSSRINFASLDKFKNMVNKDVHFILASIKTEDNSNEFSFRLHLKREPANAAAEAGASEGDSKDKKSPADQPLVEYLELEGKAKVPTAQEWSLKVKTEPPVFLVSKGNFLSDYPPARIPKEIADKPFVDYELHIDKCSPMQVAAIANAPAANSTAAAAATAAPASASAPQTTRRGRKVAAK